MDIYASISRFADYFGRHGLRSTLRRVGLAVRRSLFSGRSVLFYCDLSEEISPPAALPSFMKVERKRSAGEIDPQDLQEMTRFWNPKLACRNINERFGKGALLWLIKSTGKLAGYGWTLQGCTIEPHYFPLGQHDVHLFDFHVFPQYRGQGINPFLVSHIVRSLAAEGEQRAFIEAAEWNQAQLPSLAKTPFHRFGRARKWTILGNTIVCWAEDKVVRQAQENLSRRSAVAKGPEHI
jgi:ribosomal protein S18 acetylase RimI-like enzyme